MRAMKRQRSVPYLIFQLQDMPIAISSTYVRQIIILPEVMRLPRMPASARGLINIRGKVIPLLDLRHLLNMPGFQDEIDSLIALLRDREIDHRNWLDELESCIREGLPFGLPRDPRLCAFGKWYYSYKAENIDLMIALKRFEEPHRRIHAIADEALALAEKGDHESAYALIEKTRSCELNCMIDLFELSRMIVRDKHRELAIILAHHGETIALSVDSVESLENIDEECLDDLGNMSAHLGTDLFPRAGRREKGARFYYILDVGRLFLKKAS
jgi:chemotaxis signal transduction protein